MIKTTELIAKTKHLLPDLNTLEKSLTDEPEKIISQAFPEDEQWEARAIIRPGFNAVDFKDFDKAIEKERKRILESGRRAVNKIQKEGIDAKLEPDEAYGYEAIISMVGRPAILIQDGKFSDPPLGWENLNDYRSSIEKKCKSVGRIEVPGHPSFDWVGTGFLVAEDVVMTNRHVVRAFCDWDNEGSYVFRPGINPRIDYYEERYNPQTAEFSLTKVIGVHENFDLALLKVSRKSAESEDFPEPLTIASEVQEPDKMSNRLVYVLGYPAWDGQRNDPEVMRRIFANIYGVKRLQPGEIMRVDSQKSTFSHDCSTLGGNSGSCVVDLETAQVIGLHFAGRYLMENHAVALWALNKDPLLKQAGVLFD